MPVMAWMLLRCRRPRAPRTPLPTAGSTNEEAIADLHSEMTDHFNKVA